MKHANWFIVLALIVLASVALSGMAAAQLQSNSRIVAQVPFEFVAANHVVPTGEWSVKVATMDGSTLAISNTGAKMGLFSMAIRDEAKEGAAHYALVFNQYGDRYFLAGIKLQGSNIAYRFPESKLEAELRAQNVPATESTLLASLH